MNKHSALLLPSAFAIGLALSACLVTRTSPNADHCARADGDATCAERYGEARPHCTLPYTSEDIPCTPDDGEETYGCVVERPQLDACYVPCGGDMDVTQDDSCLEGSETETETTGTETSETETSETGPEPCEGPEDCESAEAPFCDDLSGECVGCEGVMDPDGACAELDAGVPLCVENACVQCTGEQDAACGDLTPICDVETNTCIGCSGHDECPESACNIAEGNCFDPASVVHVDGTTPCADGDGTEQDPYCDLGEALIAVPGESLIVLHPMLSNPFSYVEANTISSIVAIFGANGEVMPTVQGAGSIAALTVPGSGQLFLAGIQLSGAQLEAPGIRVNGQAWIEKSRIVNNSGGGIVVDNGGSLFLENSFVGGNVDDVDAILVVDGSAQINYSTLAGGGDLEETASALSCTPGSSVSVRNSILVAVSAGPELVCDDATVTDSALEGSLGDNLELGELVPGWFASYALGDFSLVGGMYPPAIEMAATWLDGDPATDIEGDARPTTDGMPDFAGADRIP